jgi:hypothetical protein
MRKWHDGLLAEAFQMGLDPFSGDLVIFVGRSRGRLKVLYADETGLWCSAKRFTASLMKTRLLFLSDRSVRSITTADLAMICEGASYQVEKRLLPYSPRSHIEGYAKGY